MTTVTINSEGHFSFTAHDTDDPSVTDGVTAVVSTLTLYGFEFHRIPWWYGWDVSAGNDFEIRITAVDGRGRRVDGFSGTIDLRQGTSEGDGRITPASVYVSNGRWEGRVTVYRASNHSRLYASLPSQPNITGRSN